MMKVLTSGMFRMKTRSAMALRLAGLRLIEARRGWSPSGLIMSVWLVYVS